MRLPDCRLLVVMASCATLALGAAGVFANPTNPVVTNGAATFTQTGNLLQINNTPNTIINWGSFSIAANEITRFVQQSNASAVLNRVGPGGNPSQILGRLESVLGGGGVGGRVFLINPNGITFGAGSQINVGGLVASTLNMTDTDFLAGRMKFGDGLGQRIVNQGTITTPQAGSVYLVGNAVTNSGIITSPQGEVVLAAGNSVELVNPGTPNLRVEIIAPDNEALNLGSIVAEAGRIGIYAGLIRFNGTMQANSVQVTGDGQIILVAKEVELSQQSVVTGELSVTLPPAGSLILSSCQTSAQITCQQTGSVTVGGNNAQNNTNIPNNSGVTLVTSGNITTSGGNQTIGGSVILTTTSGGACGGSTPCPPSLVVSGNSVTVVPNNANPSQSQTASLPQIDPTKTQIVPREINANLINSTNRIQHIGRGLFTENMFDFSVPKPDTVLQHVTK